MVQSHLSCNEDEKNCSIAAVCRLFINRTKNTMKQNNLYTYAMENRQLNKTN